MTSAVFPCSKFFAAKLRAGGVVTCVDVNGWRTIWNEYHLQWSKLKLNHFNWMFIYATVTFIVAWWHHARSWEVAHWSFASLLQKAGIRSLRGPLNIFELWRHYRSVASVLSAPNSFNWEHAALLFVKWTKKFILLGGFKSFTPKHSNLIWVKYLELLTAGWYFC